MNSFHRGIAYGVMFSGPIWAWVLLTAFVIGRAS